MLITLELVTGAMGLVGGFLLTGWWQWRGQRYARALSMAAGAGRVTRFLMEIGDPFMMRKCLLGIKQRAEARSQGPRRRFTT